MNFLSLSKLRNTVALATATLAILNLTGIESAKSVTLTPAEKNLEMLGETALASHAMITQAFGILRDPLTFSGNFSESGWSLNMMGTYSNLPVNIDFTGTFNEINDTGAYSSIGTIGSYSWDSSGSYIFTETVDLKTAATSDSIAIISLIPLILYFDFHYTVKEYDNNNGIIDSLGFYTITFDGKPIVEFQDLDYQDTKVPQPRLFWFLCGGKKNRDNFIEI